MHSLPRYRYVLLVWHVAFLALALCAFIGGWRAGSADIEILSFALVSMTMYVVYFGICVYYAQNRGNK